VVYKNARIIDPDGTRLADIKIEGGRIARVGRIDEDGVDLRGAWVVPALVDIGVAPKDGKLSAGSLDELARAAKWGGVGTPVLRPDLEPPLSSEIHLEFVRTHTPQIETLLLGTKEEGLTEIASLIGYARGIFVYSDTNSYLLARIFEYAKMLEVPLFVELRNETLRSVGVMNDGEVAFRLGLGGIGKLEEASEAAKVIEFGEHYGVPVVFMGVSTARTLDLIAQSSRCYAQVSVHHLLKNDTACEGYNTLAKIAPPLRDEDERLELIDALVSGRIDFLTSLHTPSSYTKKDLAFDEAAFGIDAAGSFLQLAYTHLVRPGILSMERLLELASANAAAKLGLRRGFVRPGYDAQLVRFDPEHFQEGKGLYDGEPLYGRVEFL
jgi:dihydroorotase